MRLAPIMFPTDRDDCFFDDGRDGGDKLGQGSADRDDGRRNDGLGNAADHRQLRSRIHEKFRAEYDPRRPENKFSDVDRNLFFDERHFFTGNGFLFCAPHVVDHGDGENEEEQNTSPEGKALAERSKIQNRRSGEQKYRFQRVLTAFDHGGNTDDRNRHDEPRICGDGAHGVADGEGIGAARRADARNNQLGQGGGKTDDRGADDEAGNPRNLRNPARGVHKKIAAFDDKRQTDDKKSDKPPYGPTRNRKHKREPPA